MRIASSVELRNQYGGDAGQYNATFTLQEPRQTPLGRGVTIKSMGRELGANPQPCSLCPNIVLYNLQALATGARFPT